MGRINLINGPLMAEKERNRRTMKNILSALVAIFIFCIPSLAVTDVAETAGKAIVGSVSVSTSTAVSMSSNTVTNPFAYNLCNESTTSNVRCGYSSSVSTVTASSFMGFWVKPKECEYRAVQNPVVIWCIAEGAAAINVTRELFGKLY